MKTSKTLTTALLAALTLLPAGAQRVRVKTGIEVLKERHFSLLEGKRVGLITNPTGVDSDLRLTADILHEAPNVQLVALYAPEHGIRGEAHAGERVADLRDPRTGLPVHSLHGKHRKPTPDMLQGVDVLVYDIQDIGCRSYTYVSTLGLAMQAAAECGIEFMVLDRPNPLGGHKVEGGPVEEGFRSFVSQFDIPYLYGLTCGELARLLNGEGMLGARCKLTVVPMQGWTRDIVYADTGLAWVPPSPHIPQPVSALLYPASGIVGELGYLSIGVGYTLPFQLFAAEWIRADELAGRLNALRLPGVVFRPVHFKPFYSTGQGRPMQGVQVHLTDYASARLTEIQFYVMQEVAALYPDRAVFDHADPSRFDMFDKVCGSDSIRLSFARRNRVDDMLGLWHKGVDAFKDLSKKYYLYP